MGKFDGEMEAEVRTGEAQLVGADLVEEASAVAQNDGDAGDWIPDDIAKATQSGEGDADLVPIGVEGEVLRSSDGEQALGRRGDDAGVHDVKLDGLTGRERRRKRNGSFVELAGVVGVRVEGGYGEGNGLAADADLLPVERRRDLQRNAGERGFAVVAHGKEGTDSDLLGGGVETDVEVEGGISDGAAIGVFDGGRGSHLDGGPGSRRACLGGGLAVLVSGTREDDLTAGGLGLRLGRSGGSLRRAGQCNQEDGERDACQRPGKGKLHEPRPFCGFGLDAAWPMGRAEEPLLLWFRAAARRWRKAS